MFEAFFYDIVFYYYFSLFQFSTFAALFHNVWVFLHNHTTFKVKKKKQKILKFSCKFFRLLIFLFVRCFPIEQIRLISKLIQSPYNCLCSSLQCKKSRSDSSWYLFDSREMPSNIIEAFLQAIRKIFQYMNLADFYFQFWKQMQQQMHSLQVREI